ncbi:MAG: relaxase/mobilization nuclease domain-containing protein [Bacteroidota bacterium]
MIARIAGRGHSFKGAGLYYLHDKEAMTTDRVEWTQTRNMYIQDPEAAMNYMAYTAINSDQLKKEAGVKMTGRKQERGTVYTFSLSWSPDENPDKERMVRAADETLEVLGLQEHQAVIVAHNDTNHPHIHMIVNLVNPNNGKMHDPDWGSKLKLSDWSLKHEFENGNVLCEQRVKNKKERENGKQTRYQEPRHQLKEQIQELYNQSDSGQAFSAALQEQGYTLATGNRRRFVLVDDYGKIYSLSRQLDKEQRKEHLEKLSDIRHQNLPVAHTLAEERKYFDRDKYETEQQKKIVDAAIENEQSKPSKEKEENQKVSVQPLYVKIDRLRKWEEWADRQRHTLKEQHIKAYKRSEKVELIKDLKVQIAANDNTKGRKTGRYEELQVELKTQLLNLSNIDWRIAEQTEALENKLLKSKPQGFGEEPNQKSKMKLDFEKKRNQLKDKYDELKRDYPNEKDNQQDYDLDR